MMLIGVMIMMPIMALPQARVMNAGNKKVVFSSSDDQKNIDIDPGKTMFLSWLPSSGSVEYRLSRYEDQKLVYLGEFQGNITQSRLIINGTSGSSEGTIVAKELNSEKLISAPQKVISSSAYSDVWATTSLVLTNSSDFRLTVLGDPFKGASLKSGQTSKKVVTIATGEYIIPVYYDSEQDTMSTGRQYRWAVVDKIVTEDQKEFCIRNEDLKETSNGAVVKKPIRNNLPIDFVIMSGPNQGKVILAQSSSEKLTLNIGWNAIPVQYKNENGLPIQAVLLILVGNSGRITADKKTGDILSIERENITFTTR